MRQIQIAYHGAESFLGELQNFKRMYDVPGNRKMLFQIFSEYLEEPVASAIGRAIKQVFPGIPYIGCSTGGNLVDCRFSPGISIVATLFACESTKLEVYQYDARALPLNEIAQAIVQKTREHAWVKAVELYVTMLEGPYARLCDGLKDIRPDVQIFGGIACNGDITYNGSCVCSSEGGFSKSSVLAVFYGGEDFHVDSVRVSGWKPFGKKFRVTKSDGVLLQELDEALAYDVYRKYLNIKNDKNFFYNTLEFPLLYEYNGVSLLSVPTASNADGSLVMSSEMENGATVRICYGDPKTILELIVRDGEHIYEFAPDILHVFSCVARRTFWTSNDPAYELEVFRDIASSVGFFSGGEFMRTDGRLQSHNVALVIAAMREGSRQKAETKMPAVKLRELSRIPLVSRLATFISATSLELEQMNRELERANRNLKAAVITDGLTGLYNRAEIQRRIEGSLACVERRKFSLVMLDIDNFKQVNDTYGHQKGDRVIITLANILHEVQEHSSERYSAGRWGGEEFMLLLADADCAAASAIAEKIRCCFAETSFSSMRSQTISVGVTQASEDDTIDMLCTRVDTALYQAKKSGKNKVVVA